MNLGIDYDIDGFDEEAEMEEYHACLKRCKEEEEKEDPKK